MTGRRLSPEARRAQLLELGAELFASMPYDEVHIETVAEQAGVSRGLLYHYFPNKKAFFAELVRSATAQMAEDTEANADLEPLDQLVLGVHRFLDHVRRNRHGSRAIHRGAASGDAEVQEVIEASTQLFVERIIDTLEPDGGASELLLIAVRSWVLMMRAAGQELLEHPEVGVEDVRDLCVSAFVGLLRGLPDAARPSRVDAVLDPVLGANAAPLLT